MMTVTDCRGVLLRAGLTVVYPTQNATKSVALVQAVVLDPPFTASGRVRLRVLFRAHGYPWSGAETLVRSDRLMVVTFPEVQ